MKRRSRYIKISPLISKTAEETKNLIVQKIIRVAGTKYYDGQRKRKRKTRRNRRDLEHKTYFCHPYSEWEKGGVENRIGFLRFFLGNSFDHI